MDYDSKPWFKSYDPDVSHEIEITDRSLLDRFNSVTQQLSEQNAFHYLDTSMTYDVLMKKANCFALCLVDHNLNKGDVVAINLPNTPQYLIALIGTLKAGCVVSGGLYLVLTYHLSTIERILTSIALIYLIYLQFWWTYLRYFKKKVR